MDIVQQRLYNQRIEGQKFDTPAEVVQWMGAMQAQDYHQAVWGIGLRTKGATLADVERAIQQGEILRTWPMRGTIHFVPAKDAKWMLKVSASRMIARDSRRQQQLELDTKILQQCTELFQKALSGGNRLTRPEIMHLLENNGIYTTGQRGYHILAYSAWAGQICIGPMLGKQQTFVLLDDWAPDARDLSKEDALAELARRYFTSHGPATARDFAWWAGITLTEARSGINAVNSDLVSFSKDGKEYWTASIPQDLAGEHAGVHLLPGFDEYLLGYTDRSAVLPDDHVTKVTPGKNGVFYPIIVAGGQVIGTWKRTIKKNAVEITYTPFSSGAKWSEQAMDAAKNYSSFLELPHLPIRLAQYS